jgi:hypothetical protein
MLEFRAMGIDRGTIRRCGLLPSRRPPFLVFVFNSTKRENTMPAFTFEKISPPRHSASPAHSSQKPPTSPSDDTSPQQRDNVIQVLGRFVIARVREESGSSKQSLPK